VCAYLQRIPLTAHSRAYPRQLDSLCLHIGPLWLEQFCIIRAALATFASMTQLSIYQGEI
jgi:hypothetical protein